MNRWVRRQLNISFIHAFMLFLFAVFLLRWYRKNNILNIHFDAYSISAILLSFLALHFFMRFFDSLTSFNKWLRISFTFLCVFLFLILSYYTLSVGANLDYSVIADNAGAGLHVESFKVIASTFSPRDFFEIGIILLFLAVAQKAFGALEIKNAEILPGVNIVLYATLFLAIALFTKGNLDPFASFGASVYNTYNVDVLDKLSPELKARLEVEPYPLVKSTENVAVENPPNIFIVMMESLNGNYVNATSREGKAYTPFFNSLALRGRHYTNFYGNSVQTAKGMFATFCSLIPSYIGNSFTEFEDNSFKCLAEILGENNYETYFFKAYHSLAFDNAYNFNVKNGFTYLKSMDESMVSEQERKKYSWGWGIQDDVFYKKMFKYIDAQRKKNPQKPVFVSSLTISHHNPFASVPERLWKIYPDQNDRRKKFANSMYVADSYLKEFFSQLESRDYLDNSIIFVLGDHSFPSGESGNYNSEVGYKEENFKTSLVMIDMRAQSGEVIADAYSQLNIAPTVLKLAGISTKNHFLGESLLAAAPEYIPLVQPYNGRYLGLVSHPYKFVFHQRTGRMYAYNLDVDPHEKVNIIDDIDDEKLSLYQSKLAEIYYNYYLLKQDRIWPRNETVQ
jgi:phosphoglycerol transferase MdoB-like AlkP superfamily enzyme